MSNCNFRSVAIVRKTRNGVRPMSGAQNEATAMAFGGPRSSCVRSGAHSARHQDSRNDWTPCRMAWPFVSAGAHAPHSDETPDPTPTRGSSHSARRLRSLAFLCSSIELFKKTVENYENITRLIVKTLVDNKIGEAEVHELKKCNI